MHLACAHFRHGDEFEQMQLELVSALDEIYLLMHSSGVRFFPDEQLVRLKDLVQKFGTTFQCCREMSRQRSFMAFQVTSKVHKTMHIPLIASIINPAFCVNYAEESNVGTTTRIWKAAKHGRYRARIQRVVLLRRLLAMSMRLEGFE